MLYCSVVYAYVLFSRLNSVGPTEKTLLINSFSFSSSSHYLRIARHANYAPGDTSLLYRGGHRYFRIERDDYDIDHVYSRDTYLYLCHETCEGDTQSDTIILLQYPIERLTFSAKQVRFLHIKAYKKSVHLNHIACRRTIYVEVSMLEVNQLRFIKKKTGTAVRLFAINRNAVRKRMRWVCDHAKCARCNIKRTSVWGYLGRRRYGTLVLK